MSSILGSLAVYPSLSCDPFAMSVRGPLGYADVGLTEDQVQGSGITDPLSWQRMSAPTYRLFPGSSAAYLALWAARTDITPVWAVHMLPTGASPSTALAQAASGTFDTYYANFATAISAAGFTGAIIRCMWEFNIGSWAWSASGFTTSYQQAFRHIVSVMRANGGSGFKFQWVALAAQGTSISALSTYPGDDVVDQIGLDVYDVMPDSSNYNFATLKSDLLTANPWGLNWLTSFASTPSSRTVTITGAGTITGSGTKPIVFPEWGLWPAPTGGGDNPAFIHWFSEWLVANSALLACWYPLTVEDESGNPTPNSLSAMQQEWGTSNPSTLVAGGLAVPAYAGQVISPAWGAYPTFGF